MASRTYPFEGLSPFFFHFLLLFTFPGFYFSLVLNVIVLTTPLTRLSFVFFSYTITIYPIVVIAHLIP
jgi:hypothetical protein